MARKHLQEREIRLGRHSTPGHSAAASARPRTTPKQPSPEAHAVSPLHVPGCTWRAVAKDHMTVDTSPPD